LLKGKVFSSSPAPTAAPSIDGLQITMDSDCLLRFEGDLTRRGVAELEQLARRVVATHRSSLPTVTIDVCGLMSASTTAVRALAAWAVEVSQRPPSRRLVLEVVFDGRSPWQTATFAALRAVAPDVVRLDDRSYRVGA
jgi:hypothetical protein